MNTQVTTQFRPELAVINGEIKTTSIKIAEHFNKRHERVLKCYSHTGMLKRIY